MNPWLVLAIVLVVLIVGFWLAVELDHWRHRRPPDADLRERYERTHTRDGDAVERLRRDRDRGSW